MLAEAGVELAYLVVDGCDWQHFSQQTGAGGGKGLGLVEDVVGLLVRPP